MEPVYFYSANGNRYYAERRTGADDEYNIILPAIHVIGTEEEIHTTLHCLELGRLQQIVKEAIKLGLHPEIRRQCSVVDKEVIKGAPA